MLHAKKCGLFVYVRYARKRGIIMSTSKLKPIHSGLLMCGNFVAEKKEDVCSSRVSFISVALCVLEQKLRFVYCLDER